MGDIYVVKRSERFVFDPLNLASSINSEDDIATGRFARLVCICTPVWPRGCIVVSTYRMRGLAGVAYPLLMAMREPKGSDKQSDSSPRIFYIDVLQCCLNGVRGRTAKNFYMKKLIFTLILMLSALSASAEIGVEKIMDSFSLFSFGQGMIVAEDGISDFVRAYYETDYEKKEVSVFIYDENYDIIKKNGI